VKDDRIWCGYFIIVYNRPFRYLSSERYKIVDFLKNAVCYLNSRHYKIEEFLKNVLYYLNSGRYKKKVNRIFVGKKKLIGYFWGSSGQKYFYKFVRRVRKN
jgi:hypothetical protein